MLTVRDVLGLLGLSRTRLRAFDGELKPTRGTANERLYDPARVDELLARRRTAAEQRARHRVGRLLAGRPTAEARR